MKTVAELVAELSALPQHLPVYLTLGMIDAPLAGVSAQPVTLYTLNDKRDDGSIRQDHGPVNISEDDDGCKVTSGVVLCSDDAWFWELARHES